MALGSTTRPAGVQISNPADLCLGLNVLRLLIHAFELVGLQWNWRGIGDKMAAKNLRGRF